jgi:hypothetical protein
MRKQTITVRELSVKPGLTKAQAREDERMRGKYARDDVYENFKFRQFCRPGFGELGKNAKKRARATNVYKQELNSSVTSCDKARRGGKIH